VDDVLLAEHVQVDAPQVYIQPLRGDVVDLEESAFLTWRRDYEVFGNLVC